MNFYSFSIHKEICRSQSDKEINVSWFVGGLGDINMYQNILKFNFVATLNLLKKCI